MEESSLLFSLLSIKNIYIGVSKFFFLFFQPKSEDEEGWKKFCLGERLYAEGAVGPAASESPGIDYVQVGDNVAKQTEKGHNFGS